jgi:Ca2+-binding RTX toxin-like protein
MGVFSFSKTPGINDPAGFISTAYTTAMLFDYDFVNGTASVYRLYDNASNDFTFYGSGFAYNSLFQPTAGVVNSLVYRVGGVTIATASSLSVSALDLTNAANSGSMANYYSVLFAGNDSVYGTSLDDTLRFGSNAGNDVMYGLTGNDDIFAGLGNDTIFGGAGNDFLEGEDGNDFFYGDSGSDVIKGGAGTDTVYYGASLSAVSVNLVTQTGTGGDAQGDSYNFIETVFGSSFGDSITGDGAANTLVGLGGNDVLSGGFGADYMDGGAGSDWVFYDTAFSTGVIIYLNYHVGYLSAAEGDVYVEIENVLGSASADIIFGDAQANYLAGSGGDDFLAGGAGADILSGGDGTDTVSYAASAAGVSAYLGYNYGAGGDAQGDSYSLVEGLVGSAFADGLIGTSASNFISTGHGIDFVLGDVSAAAAATDYFFFQNDIAANEYDLVVDFNAGSVNDVLYLSAALQASTSFGDYGGYGFAAVDTGSGYYLVLATVSGAALQAQTLFL